MKPPLSKSHRETGNILVVTLFIGLLLGVFLVYYLNLSRAQKRTVIRSQAWNSAITMAEAGQEEALAQLNPGAPLAVIDRSANGWGAPVAGIYGPVSRSLGSGTYSVIYNTNKYPIIYSTGYVSVPYLGATLSRTIRVSTTNIPLFNVAMAAINNIDFKGNNANTDSFDSMNTNLSSNGIYDPAKASTNGDVASASGVVDVGNANIHGDLYLSPSGTDGVSANGTVTGTVYHDFNAVFSDVVLPDGTALWVQAPVLSKTISGTSYLYSFFNTTNDYMLPSLAANVYVSNAVVRLLINGPAAPTYIRVAGTGNYAGKLIIYMNGSTFTLSGNAIVDGGNAANLSYFGTTNNTSISFSGNASFIGTVYAPEAVFSLGGGGNNTYDFSGSIVAKSISVNGHFNFHYDENLLRNGPLKGYAATSWREL